jgi:hypothetical protein
VDSLPAQAECQSELDHSRQLRRPRRLEEMARKAGEFLTALRLHGTDPHDQKAKAA